MPIWIQKQVGLIWFFCSLDGSHGFFPTTVPGRRAVWLPSASADGDGGMDATARAFLAYQTPPVTDDPRSDSKSAMEAAQKVMVEQEPTDELIVFDNSSMQSNDDKGLESNEQNGEQMPVEDTILASATALLDEEGLEVVPTGRSNSEVPTEWTAEDVVVSQEATVAQDEIEPLRSNKIQSTIEVETIDHATADQESKLDEKARLLFGGEEATNGKEVVNAEVQLNSAAAVDRKDQDISVETTTAAPTAPVKATITKVTSLSSSSKVNSVVATTRARQRLKEEEEAKPNVLLQIIGDLVFSKTDDDDKKTPPRKEDESPILKELTESLKSKIKSETTTKTDPVAVPPETYRFNINAKQGVWNPSEEEDDGIEEAAQRSWTASLDSRGNFWVTYFDEETTDAIPRQTGEGANDWDQYQNASGRIYFVNRATGESQWHVPPGFEVVDMQNPEEEVEPEAASQPPAVVSAKEDKTVVMSSVDQGEPKTNSALPPILTPIQRLLGEMSVEEKEELSMGVKNKVETTTDGGKTSGVPSPIQRLLAQMQKEEDSDSTTKLEISGQKTIGDKPDTTSGLPYPIQRLFNQKSQQQEDEDGKTKPQTGKTKPKSAGVKPFWAASNTTPPSRAKEPSPPVDKKPQGIRPFWNLKK